MNIEKVVAWVGLGLALCSAAGTGAVLLNDVSDLKSKAKEYGEKISALEFKVATVAKGDQGLQGPKGEHGEQGPKGDKGDAGPAGQIVADTDGTRLVEECRTMAISQGLAKNANWIVATNTIIEHGQITGMSVKLNTILGGENESIICEKYDYIKYPVIHWEKTTSQAGQ